MSPLNHPFQPGTKVAHVHHNRWESDLITVREDEVLKVYKNGNFTLKSAPTQQFRANFFRSYGDPNPLWNAHPTGDDRFRESIQLVDDRLRAEIAEASASRTRRWKVAEVKSLANALPNRYAAGSAEERLIDALYALYALLKPATTEDPS